MASRSPPTAPVTCRPRTDVVMRYRRDERGSVGPLMIAFVVVAALGVTAVAQLGDAAVRRARVEAHADVAALAVVTAGTERASSALARSGAQLADVVSHPDGARTVVVELAGVRSSATAAPRGEPFGHDR